MNFRIVDPNQSPTRRLIAETDYVDIAESIARMYFTERYVRQDPRRNNYATKPVRIVHVKTGRLDTEIGFIPVSEFKVGKVGS